MYESYLYVGSVVSSFILRVYLVAVYIQLSCEVVTNMTLWVLFQVNVVAIRFIASFTLFRADGATALFDCSFLNMYRR